MKIKYEVHTALSDDTNEGWIWIKLPQSNTLYEEIKDRRPIVCIEGENAKRVYCEALYTDNSYLKRWKKLYKEKWGKDIKFGDNVIFISAWYRRLLGIEEEIFDPPPIIELDVKSLHPLALRALLYRYPRDHPQAVVRTANMIAIIAFGLGIWGIALGFPGLKDWLGPFWVLFGLIFLLVVGLAIIVLGITGLIWR